MKFRILNLLVLLPIACFSQLDSLKGRIKSIKQTVSYADNFLVKGLLQNREMDYGQYSLSYETIFNEFSKDLFPNRSTNYTKEFDEQGRLTKLFRSFFSDTLVNITYYTYNEYNNLIQEKDINEDGSFTVRNYYYIPLGDSSDHLVSEIQYESDPEIFEMKHYYYNKRNQLIEIREASQTRWEHQTNYQYDIAGRLIKELNFIIEKKPAIDDSTGVEKIIDSLDIYYKKEYEYNSDGTIKLKIDGCAPYLIKLACAKTFFEYDNNKRVINKTVFWGDSLYSRREFQYNPDNTLKRIAWFYKREVNPRNFVEYFYKNKEMTKAIFIDDGNKTEFEFKYKLDAQNNWIEQIKFVDNKPFYVRKREFTYWDLD